MASLSLPSFSQSWNYDVFLSFRGEDTRKIFVDHLYIALVKRLIRTYKDNEELPRGASIGPTLLQAIRQSRIAVIIFSKNYADSSWCLDELAYIMECRRERGLISIPIFYHVDPSEVRNQKGDFGIAFAKQVLKNNKKAEMWRRALTDASNIAGWEPKHIANGHEALCIEQIVDTILDKLLSLNSDVNEALVGMGTRLQDLKSKLEIGSGGVRMVGIWGIGGSGKTTLASSIYMEISQHFVGQCIIENVGDESRKNGLTSLQNKILSTILKTQVVVECDFDGRHKIKNKLCHSNVLLVLDDVDDLCQLESLAGSHNWFGYGSRIIITTRDKNLLTAHNVDLVSPISLLSNDEAIRLFNRHSYQGNHLVEDYETLSKRVVSHAAGLPLALKIFGSLLCDKDTNEWISTLAKLKDISDRKVIDKLKISYDRLEPYEKDLFLDIACFFRGHPKDERMEIFDACGFHSHIGVKVLMQKSLITISDGKFDMHNLVQDMGHYIVRGEPPKNPRKHSRVWREEDIEEMCSAYATTIKENNKIEAIRFYGESPHFPVLVSNLKKLRLLICKCILRQKYDTKVFAAPTFLSNELCYIHLSGYLASPLPDNFQPRKLVILTLHNSLHEEIWRGNKHLPNLKQLNLYDAWNLLSTPDFDGFPCLEKLTISGCPKLEEIHPSLGNHRSLVYITVDSCDKLRTLPTFTQLKKLKSLKISNCKQFFMFPDIRSNMDSLEKLSLYDVGMLMLPSSIQQRCTNLTSLELNGYEYLKS